MTEEMVLTEEITLEQIKEAGEMKKIDLKTFFKLSDTEQNKNFGHNALIKRNLIRIVLRDLDISFSEEERLNSIVQVFTLNNKNVCCNHFQIFLYSKEFSYYKNDHRIGYINKLTQIQEENGGLQRGDEAVPH